MAEDIILDFHKNSDMAVMILRLVFKCVQILKPHYLIYVLLIPSITKIFQVEDIS